MSITEGKAIFLSEVASEPLVIETVRIHEAWATLAEELLKWGEFKRSKDLATESALHSRILKDADCYSRSLLTLSSIAFVEGNSAQALKDSMMSHACVRDMALVEKCFVHTFNILAHFKKWDDVQSLLNPLNDMLLSFRRTNTDSKTVVKQETQKNK